MKLQFNDPVKSLNFEYPHLFYGEKKLKMKVNVHRVLDIDSQSLKSVENGSLLPVLDFFYSRSVPCSQRVEKDILARQGLTDSSEDPQEILDMKNSISSQFEEELSVIESWVRSQYPENDISTLYVGGTRWYMSVPPGDILEVGIQMKQKVVIIVNTVIPEQSDMLPKQLKENNSVSESVDE